VGALAFAVPAVADQRYAVSGNDRYQLGQADLQTSISYNGTQNLTVSKNGDQTRFTAQVRYTRADSSGAVPEQATFVQDLTPAGELQDRADQDPDYLTVLNQPFAIELDRQTLRDLLHLKGELPFVFPAPMTGGTLRGYLQRGHVEHVAAHRALAVRFDATGPMSGPLPDHNDMSITGTMRMHGVAYYAVEGEPLLLALNETLTITGTLHTGPQASPVTIQYQRWIKANDSAAPSAAAASP
jgi:hypothetical protein